MIALEADLQHAMATRADRSRATRYERVLEVMVEPVRARYGAWYEMFPRSAGTDPSRSATFDEAAEPAAVRRRHGLRRALPAADPPDRPELPQGAEQHAAARARTIPGSPWAIGGEAGGHTAVEPGLGTLDDFDRFVAAARGARPRDRARPRLPGLARSSLRQGASRSGSATAPTARSSTRRTRRRSTRTSTRSTSSPRTGRRSGRS